MSYLSIIVSIVLIQLTWGYSEEFYPVSENFDLEGPYLYPEDLDENNDFKVRRRNSNFLRFGRSGGKMHDLEYDDYSEDFARPTRSGKTEKNDNFIRFGRGNNQDFLRFGRNGRNGASYLRFGRSILPESEKKRSKRDAYSDFKRGGSNFMRFGRNSNFLRFGRTNNEVPSTINPEKYHQLQGSPLIHMLSELIENLKHEQNKSNVV